MSRGRERRKLSVMVAAHPLPYPSPSPPPPSELRPSARETSAPMPAFTNSPEERITLFGVPWKTYVVMRELLDSPGLKMTYDQGTLELLVPSDLHEIRRKSVARLVEMFAIERDFPLQGYGSTTFRREAKERGLEPDECYFIGKKQTDFPDIAIEVVITSGGLAKLPIYESLGVREVWFWEDGAFHLHALREGGYEPIAKSELLPGLDFDVLTRFAQRDDQHEAVKGYRDHLRSAA